MALELGSKLSLKDANFSIDTTFSPALSLVSKHPIAPAAYFRSIENTDTFDTRARQLPNG